MFQSRKAMRVALQLELPIALQSARETMDIRSIRNGKTKTSLREKLKPHLRKWPLLVLRDKDVGHGSAKKTAQRSEAFKLRFEACHGQVLDTVTPAHNS